MTWGMVWDGDLWDLVQSTKTLLEEKVHTNVEVYCLFRQLLVMVALDGVGMGGSL